MLSGVGNVYRAEALFMNGLHPLRAGRDCTPLELAALWSTVAAMLRRGARDDRDRYLRCDTPIEIVTLGGRACYFCPTCQSA